MPFVHNKHEREDPKVHDKDGQIPQHQAYISGGMDSYFTIPATPQFSSSALGTNSSLYFDLERDECGQINDVCLRFTVSCTTADVSVTPSAYWFKRIVIESSKGSGDELIHIYPEQLMMWHYLTQDEEARDRWSKLSNFANVKLSEDGRAEKYYDSQKTIFRVGDTRDVFIRLPALFLHLNSIDMNHIRSDLRIRMEMSNDIVVSGAVGNLSLDNVHLLIRSFKEEHYDLEYRKARQQKATQKYVYLDCERLQINDKTLTAGAITKFNLDQFVGKCPFLVVVVKPAISPIASDRSLYNFVELGKDATFDITNSGSQSLLGNGTALKQDQIYNIFCQQTGNPHLKGVYLIPFCDSVKKSVAGIVNGIFDFNGLRDYLDIQFGSAPVQEVHTIATDSLGVTGTFRYSFENGAVSDQDVDYDDTAADIKTIIDAIPELQERGITVTVNDGFDAVTSQTITYNTQAGRVVDELGKITVNGNGFDMPKINQTTVSTYGSTGTTTGSGYQVEIFMYKFKTLYVNKHGDLHCKDL